MAMKPSDVTRGVRRGVRLRQPGSAPNVGRVERLHRVFQGKEAHSDDPARQKRRLARKRAMLGWSIGAAMVTLGILVGAFVVWVRPMLNRARDTSERDRQADEQRVRIASKFPSPSESAATAILERALAVRDPHAAEKWFRLGPASGAEVVAFLEGLQSEDDPHAKILWDGSVDKNGLSLEGLMVTYGEGKPEQQRLAFLTPDEKGEWKVDFGAFARWTQPSWTEVLEQNVEQAEIRVLVGAEHLPYYNGVFRDDLEWSAYKMVSPDLRNESLEGYCKRGSAQDRALQRILQESELGQSQRATLQVRRVPGSERKQLEILRVLAEDWVLAPQPFDERF